MLDNKTKTMQDSFQWTPELWKEFTNSQIFDGAMEQFKSSKSPKKEWEIVAYAGDIGFGRRIYELCDDGEYRWKADLDKIPRSAKHLIDLGCTIHSVRRLSDGEVFSVDEPVKTSFEKRIINSFSIEFGKLHAEFSGGSASLSILQKLPQPILTTADQKDLFSRQDEVWVVNKDNEIIHRYVDTILDHGYVFQDCRFYSTPEAARDYVLNHAPLLSLSDVRETYDTLQPDETVFGKLTALVKQKLNQ